MSQDEFNDRRAFSKARNRVHRKFLRAMEGEDSTVVIATLCMVIGDITGTNVLPTELAEPLSNAQRQALLRQRRRYGRNGQWSDRNEESNGEVTECVTETVTESVTEPVTPPLL